MSLFFGNRLNQFKMKPVGDGDAGGGTGGDGKGDPPKPPSTEDLRKEFEATKAQNAALLARLEALEKKGTPPASESDLTEKARLEREAAAKKGVDQKTLESSLAFTMRSEEFLKQNSAYLPKDVADIFKVAEKENFESTVEKAAAIKAGIIKSFFAVQSNMDLLTAGPKSQLEEFLKLTKNGQQDRANQIYDLVFEPAFSTLRAVKKAEAVNKGYGTGTPTDDKFLQKMLNVSKNHYLGEKPNA